MHFRMQSFASQFGSVRGGLVHSISQQPHDVHAIATQTPSLDWWIPTPFWVPVRGYWFFGMSRTAPFEFSSSMCDCCDQTKWLAGSSFAKKKTNLEKWEGSMSLACGESKFSIFKKLLLTISNALQGLFIKLIVANWQLVKIKKKWKTSTPLPCAGKCRERSC